MLSILLVIMLAISLIMLTIIAFFTLFGRSIVVNSLDTATRSKFFSHSAISHVQYYRSNWGERERAPSCGLDGRAVTIYIYTSDIYIRPARPYVHRYCACAALRANVAGRIGNRVSPAESAFSACIGSGSSQT